MDMWHSIRRSAGFTAVELLVVIIVISLLSAVVYASYQSYEKNAQGAQAAVTISSFKSAIETGVTIETDTTPSESYSQDGDFLAACVTSNTERCCFYYHLYQQVLCYNNNELKTEGLLDTDYTYDILQKYVNDKSSQMPNFSDYGTLTKCTTKRDGVSYTMIPPCYSNQVAYTTGQLTTNDQGFLHYYLPSKYENCNSDKVVSYDSGFPELKGAAYTERSTASGGPQYTYCIVLLGKE